MRDRDAFLIAFTDKQELEDMRRSFLRRTLRLTEPDDRLDEAIKVVEDLMKSARHKSALPVYDLLAHAFGKLSEFS